MKEKAGTTALGELVLLIARDEGIQRALARFGEGHIASLNIEAVTALRSFLEQYRLPEPPSAPVLEQRPVAPKKAVAPIPPPSPTASPGPVEIRKPAPVAPLPGTPRTELPMPKQPEPVRLEAEVPPQASREPEKAVPKPAQASAPKPPVPKEEPAIVAHREPEKPLRTEPWPPHQETTVSIPVVEPEVPEVREPLDFEDQQSYVYGVSLIPLSDSPSPTAFLLNEKALDQRTKVFAVDHAGMRFFMSELYPDSFSLSKNGMLLLNKTDSLRLRGAHERIVNRLRLKGHILPAEFGTAVLGRQDFARRVEFRLHALLEFVLELAKTTTWHLSALVLDDRVQQLVGAETATQRSARPETDRGRHGAPTKRIDVKALERLLTREKKIAESILDALAPFAENQRVEQMVNLGSGRSEDWKAILKAVLTLPAGQNQRFFRAVVDVEAANEMIEPMLRVTGSTESFSLLM
jgi:hypothetical protein